MYVHVHAQSYEFRCVGDSTCVEVEGQFPVSFFITHVVWDRSICCCMHEASWPGFQTLSFLHLPQLHRITDACLHTQIYRFKVRFSCLCSNTLLTEPSVQLKVCLEIRTFIYYMNITNFTWKLSTLYTHCTRNSLPFPHSLLQWGTQREK